MRDAHVMKTCQVLRITKSYVPSTCRRLLHYPAVNWNAVWAARPSHNGDSEEQRWEQYLRMHLHVQLVWVTVWSVAWIHIWCEQGELQWKVVCIKSRPVVMLYSRKFTRLPTEYKFCESSTTSIWKATRFWTYWPTTFTCKGLLWIFAWYWADTKLNS